MRTVILILILIFANLNASSTTKRDHNTNLLWQDDKASSTVLKDYHSAKKYCEKLNTGNKKWILPTQSQLLSISNKNRYLPAINPDFKHVSPEKYWSSTKSSKYKNFFWYVDFKDGHSYVSIKNKKFNVRCVRKEKQEISDLNTLMVNLVEDKLKNYPTFEKALKISKGEFEKTSTYKKRAAKASKSRDKRIKAYKKKHDEAKLKAKNFALKRALEIKYGKPVFSEPIYDADNEQFISRMHFEAKPKFNKKVSLRIPIKQAKEFKDKIKENKLKPKAVFSYDGQNVKLKSIYVKYKGKRRQIAFTDMDIDDTFASVKLVSTPDVDNSYSSTMRMGENQIAQVSSDEMMSLHDLDHMLKRKSQVKVDKKKWLFVVGIEKYEMTDNIIYATKSAKMFASIAKKRLGVHVRQSYVLINEQATQTKIKRRMKKMLKRVKTGDTIYFYYNGHGIPVPHLKNEPFILPSDMEADSISEEKFFSLKNIYTTLSNSKADKVIAVVDSCFSGVTDGKGILKGVAATKMVARKVDFNREKMVVMTAGKGHQYSNGYDKKGHRLFSYHIMKNILNGDKDIKTLYKHTKKQTYDTSFEEYGDSRIQEPDIVGNKRMEL